MPVDEHAVDPSPRAHTFWPVPAAVPCVGDTWTQSATVVSPPETGTLVTHTPSVAEVNLATPGETVALPETVGAAAERRPAFAVKAGDANATSGDDAPMRALQRAAASLAESAVPE